MLRKTHEIRLKFFQDDAHGEWGVASEETLRHADDGNRFNAFWNGEGLFHDVFEHSQEFSHPWFRGEAALNVGGEMFAMGALVYYMAKLGLNRFPNTSRWQGPGELALNTTYEIVKNAVKEGYNDFGDRLVSHVPRQKPVADYELESMLDEYVYRIVSLRPPLGIGRMYEYSQMYKRSLRAFKVRDLHRAGWRWAKSIVPDNNKNSQTLQDFIAFWTKYTKQNKAEELANYFRYLDFTLFLDDEDNVSWKAELVPNPGFRFEDYEMEQPKTHFSSVELKRAAEEKSLPSAPETYSLPLS